jgi:predicted N-acetyltransferase YhbS
MNVSLTCNLSPQTVLVNGEKRSAFGLAMLHSSPSNFGLGRDFLRALERVATKEGYDLIVGWATPDVMAFYAKCGWCVADNKIVSKLDGLTKRAVWWSNKIEHKSGHKIEPLNEDW